MAERLAPSERHVYEHGGRRVYEWDQTVDEVNVFVTPPPGTTAKMVFCTVRARGVALGLQGNPPFLDCETAGAVKVADSFWTLEDGVLHVTLQKQTPGEPWPAVFVGHRGLDPARQQAETQRLMLERFQLENPGFDFSGAEFNGAAPDPSKFLGGVRRR